MRTKLQTLALFVAALAVALLCFTQNARAASQTRALFTIDKPYNMAISFDYDKEKPSVSFTAPDGTVYDQTAISRGSMYTQEGSDWIVYYIPQAAAGAWSVTYDQLSNTKCDIHYSSYMYNISIDAFSMQQPSGDTLPVAFLVSSNAGGSYSYEIYAVITDDSGQVTGERLLTNGTATLNSSITLNASLQQLSDYDTYKLRLDVTQTEGVEEVTDSRIADGTFGVSGHSQGLSPMTGIDAEVNLTDHTLRIDWSKYGVYCDSYLLAVFDDKGSSEPFFFSSYGNSETSTEVPFDGNLQSARVELRYIQGGVNSQPFTKNIPLVGPVKVNIATPELTNGSQAKIEYETSGPINARIIVNGSEEELVLNGKDYFSVDLASNTNNLEIRYSAGDPAIVYRVLATIVMDAVPPVLRLPENAAPLYVSDGSYMIAGVTEPNCIVTISGKPVTVSADGVFTSSVSLNLGENVVPVTSTDKAGNVSSQDVIIYKTDVAVAAGTSPFMTALTKYLPVIVSFLASALLLAVVWLIARFGKKSDNKLRFVLGTARTILIVLGSLSLAGAGYCAWRYISLRNLLSSDAFFKLAQSSVDEAYNALSKVELYKGLLIDAAVAAGLAAVLAVLISLVLRALKNRKLKPKKEAAPKPEKMPPQAAVKPQKQEPQVKKPEKFTCPNCGAEYDVPPKFCAKCGKPLQ